MSFGFVTLTEPNVWTTVPNVSHSSFQRLTIIPTRQNTGPVTTTVNTPGNIRQGFFTGISLLAGELVSIAASGMWSYGGPEAVGPDGYPGSSADPTFVLPGAPTISLIGKVGTGGSWFHIGSSKSFTAPIDGPLFLTMNDWNLDSEFANNSGTLAVSITKAALAPPSMSARVGGGISFGVGSHFDGFTSASGDVQVSFNGTNNEVVSALVISGPLSAPDSDAPCLVGGVSPEVTTSNPIELRTGNKVISITDLSLNSPASALTFTRSYNHKRLSDTNYAFMGKGWSHNHRYVLSFTGFSPNRTAKIDLGDGSSLKLNETTPGGHFNPGSGATSSLDYVYNTAASAYEYVLTTVDQMTFVFDAISPYALKRRTWINGENWNYYYAGTDLIRVEDEYGRELHFTYHAGHTGDDTFKNGKLWRVGDQTATGLDTSTPSGRYIEFDYVREKLNGTLTANQVPLLYSIRDARGKTWTYDYYGQHVGESASVLKNFLTKRLSPDIDDNPGNGVTALTLETLQYTVNASSKITRIIQQRGDGLLQTQFDFPVGALNFTTQKRAGRTETHHFADGVYVGSANPKHHLSWQVLKDNYRPAGTGDANGQQTTLVWSPDGKRLTSVTDALSHETQFTYDSANRLQSSLDAENRKTTYLYNVNLRQPTLILVSDQSTIIDVNGGMEADSGWATVGTPTTHERSTTQVESGTYARRVVATAPGQGMESIPWNFGADHTYLIMARVYPVSFDVKMQVTGETAFDRTSSGNGAWQTLRAVYTPGAAATGKRLQFVASGGAAEFYLDSVHIVDLVNLQRWQEFIYIDKGRLESEGLVDPATGNLLQQGIRTYATSGNGNGLLSSVTQRDLLNPANDVSTTYTYDSAGRVTKTQQSSLLGSCQVSYTVFDPVGNVVASICNYNNTGAAPTTAAEAVALYNPAQPDENHVTTHEYDALGRRVKTTVNAGASFAQTTLTSYDALDRVIRTINNYVPDSSIPDPYTAAHSAFSHGADNSQNLVSDTAYNARGWVRKQTDVLGNVTLYGYDDADQLIKTIHNAAQPNYNNDYSGISPDPTLSSYTPDSNADQDIIITNEYDPTGNLVKTIDVLGNVTFTVYDALNRPVKVVHSAKTAATIALNPGDIGYNSANDPRSPNYAPSSDPDRDLIDTTEYDAMGRVIRTARLLDNRPSVLWDTTLYGYDPLGRQVKVIQHARQPNYNIAADPTLSAYSTSSAADQDIVTKTAYDEKGQVLYTEDTLGARTWFKYDGLGRQVKTIASAVGTATDGGVNDPRSDSYVPSTDPDKDLISCTVYNTDGQVESTEDTLGRKTRFVYDSLGRRTRTVTNFIDQGENPANWVWNNGWKKSDGTTPIAHGTDQDQNIVSSTVYDAQGRAMQTIDHRNNITQFVYDILGRQVKTISNYTPQDASNPADWVWDDAVGQKRWEDGAGNAISFGADNDQNAITATSYDLAGRVIRTRDTVGMETRYEYDANGRRTQSITNYIDGTFSSASPDEDLISTVSYNKAGQVISTTDVRGTQTAFSYDAVGRQHSIIQAATSPQAVTSYTCFDKAGRVLRTIQNYTANSSDPSPDARDANGQWLFNPAIHGPENDQNLITIYEMDRAGRTFLVTNPAGNQTLTAYEKDGQVRWITDPEAMVTQYCYDQRRRRTRVVQGYLPYQTQAKLVFSSDPGTGSEDIFVRNLDGANLINLTNHAAGDWYPRWSPDGQQIAFSSNRGTATDIYLMDADGSDVQLIAQRENSNFVAGVAWSPSGDYLVFDKPEGGVYKLYTIRSDGSDLQLLFGDANLNAGYMSWSPDGNRIAFSIYNATSTDIAVIHADGSQLRYLSHNITNGLPITGGRPSWSPDGSKLAFDTQQNNQGQIYVINADGSNRIPLTSSTGFNFFPRWSADGQQLVFYSNRDGNTELYVMNADGSNQTRLTNNTPADRFPDWLPTVVDPADWVWDVGQSQWEDGNNNPIPHGANNDRNIIVDVTYDKAGRMTSLRDPRGNLTTYAYDQLNRRKTLTNPLSQAWTTAYENLVAGGTRTTMTYPNGGTHQVQREFDRLGRLKTIQYLNESPKHTPDVKFTYTVAGNRTAMSEYTGINFTNRVRETQYGYDDVRRLTSVGFDNDGNGSVDQSVSYEYDAGGLRTKLTLPGSFDLTYTYDAKGRLVSLTDWDNQTTTFAHDNANRLLASVRSNGLRCRYNYDAASRLRWLRHTKNNKTLAHIAYEVDRRGNRTRAQEAFVGAATTSEAGVIYNDPGIAYKGAWSDNEPFMATSDTGASLRFAFMVNLDAATPPQFTFGVGPDHGIFDVYIGGTLWQSLDGYAASASERTVSVNVTEEGPLTFELRNRQEKNLASSGYKVRFKQLIVHDFSYSLFTHFYSYDALSRLISDARHWGFNNSISNASSYGYTYDRAGNRLSETLVIHDQYGFPSVIPKFSATYNAANQISSSGFTYDANGNLTHDNANNTYTWDRANRLLNVDAPDGHIPGIDTSYAYDGMGNRIQQTYGSTVTQYLLDLQPGLSVVLAATEGVNTTRYVHGPTGIHAQEDSAGNWEWMIQDGLGSVRSVVDNNLAWIDGSFYEPYGAGNSLGDTTIYGFTGEPTDPNGLVHLRARYYAPNLGVFPSLDPFEGKMQRTMSLNGYSWVEGNVVNAIDPSGLIPEEEAIRLGNVEFTCNCGWIDWDHITNSNSKTFTLLDDIQYVIDNGQSGQFWAIRFNIQVGFLGELELDLFNDLAVMPSENATAGRKLHIATNIFMEANEIFEEFQLRLAEDVGMLDTPLSPILSGEIARQGRASYFAEEDLVSDIIGFYIAYERHNTGKSSEQLRKFVRKLCGTVNNGSDTTNSLQVFTETYANGANLMTGWNQWRPRFIPLTGCNSNLCQKDRNWPSEFESITNLYDRDSITRGWTWYSLIADAPDPISIGVANRPNVYLLPR